MKNKKLLIGIIIGLVVAIIIVVAVVVINLIQNKKFEESDYISKGQYFEKFIEENNLYSDIYTEEEIVNAKDYKIDAAIMVEWKLITKKQAKNPQKPLTKEIVAQSVVNFMAFRQTHDIEIIDINNCYDKQAIIDAVGMGIFELEDGKFNPDDYMTFDEVSEVFEKMHEIEADADFSEEEIEAKVDWSKLDFTINEIEYNFPLKVANFIDNGWIAESSDVEEILNKIIDEDFLPREDGILYIGFNSVYLKQNGLSMMVIFDTNITNIKVLEANVTYFEIAKKNDTTKDNFNFYGINFNSTEDEVKELLGTKNYSSSYLSDDFYTYTYNNQMGDSTLDQLILVFDKKTNKVVKFGISKS